MKTKILLSIFFSIATLLAGCKKDDLNIEDGTYKGTFSVTYSSGIKTGQTTLVLTNGKFSCSGNSNRIPAGGSGTFSSDNNKITFNDENFWTAEFDPNLILKGTYTYTFDGKKLKIYAERNGIGNFNYYLEKQ
ncbi:hypothetical protein VB264_17800 [Arcicella aquatica]|uniref:Lipocalin-like domain-containing protein n=1 Tax=Arcicella aquatica TaxID=217141 RepID=A0ABU5QRZ5_9BACT|nr:hypothetical protein [Arcicella aquatica]MEA5259655.1 hypothetical protein [Arcicella aquatica]